jgi:hypothetical protein
LGFGLNQKNHDDRKAIVEKKKPYKKHGPSFMRKRARTHSGTSCTGFSNFLLTRWLRNILFVMFFEESIARE